jgi:xylan 1,4-beta-xylosidase
MKLLCVLAVLSAAYASPVTLPAQTPSSTSAASDTSIRLVANAKGSGQPLVHFWSKVVGAGRANEGLRSTWQEELQTAVKYDGFQYVRFHGLFHDDMFVYREDKDGRPVYNFQYVDDLFDRMLQAGARPFVELSFVPTEMATAKATTFWWKANGGPPTDYNKWAALVQHLVDHCIARYGIDEVRRWYFEVWNEPNLTDGFFKGTQKQYFDLYKITAETIKKSDPQLRVGGPATSNFDLDQDALKQAQASAKPYDPLTIPWRPVWIDDFLHYCKQNNLPVDFVSTHPYPQDFAIDDPRLPHGGQLRRSIDATRDDLRLLRKVIDASPYPKAEIQLTEWSSSPSPTDHTHDSLAAAAFIVKTNIESVGQVDSLSYWVFTDVFEENRETDSIFHGGFGLINYQQIVKPAFHGYRFLNNLGDEMLQQVVGGVVTRDSKSGRVTALAYNYPPEMLVSLPLTSSVEAADQIDSEGSARAFSLKLTGLPANAPFMIETLDRTHGNAIAGWESMGRPEPPSREQTEALRAMAWETGKEIVRADAAGVLDIHRKLDAWTVLLISQM